jgi:hypothetical protein
MQTRILNEAQMHILQMFSFCKTKSDLERLQEVLADYYENEAQRQLDLLWESGKMSQEKLDMLQKADLHKLIEKK